MITSKLFQAAESALDQIHEMYSEAEVDEALAFLGVGPRAFNRFASKLNGGGNLKPFLLGVLAERLALSVNLKLIDEEEAMELLGTGDDEPYEEAAKEDIQDILQMAYGFETDDEMTIETLMEILISEVLTDDESKNLGPILDPKPGGRDPIDPIDWAAMASTGEIPAIGRP